MSLFDDIAARDVNRRKYGQLQQMCGTTDVLPLWITDMDFVTSEPIMSTLYSVVSQSVQGYNLDYSQRKEPVIHWYAQQYDADTKAHWLHFIPGVIKAIVLFLIALTRPDDSILTCTPTYDPYPNLVNTSGRNLIQTRLIEKDGHYEFDWHDFSEKLKQCKIFLFPLPHNPGGMARSRETLEKISHYCQQTGVVILSDEMYSDLTLPGKRHLPFFIVDEALDSQSIVPTSISRIFNTAVVQGGVAIIENDESCHQFHRFLDNCYLAEAHSPQQAAIYSAFTHCADWHQKLLTYLADNVAFARCEIEKYCPLISVVYDGVSYLLLLNVEKMDLSDEQLSASFVHDARLGLSPGAQHGPGGGGYMRFNIGCPRPVLIDAMNRLKAACQK